VDLAVVAATERNSEFITGLACHGPVLGEAEVMRVCGMSAADEATLLGNEFDVFASTNADTNMVSSPRPRYEFVQCGARAYSAGG